MVAAVRDEPGILYRCRGCNKPLMGVDVLLRSFHLLAPVRGLRVSTRGDGWAEVRCPYCGTHQRLEASTYTTGRPPGSTKNRSDQIDQI